MFRKVSTYLLNKFLYLYLASGRILRKKGDSVTTYVLRTNSPEARRLGYTKKPLGRLQGYEALVALED